jgi:hypothetical protein
MCRNVFGCHTRGDALLNQTMTRTTQVATRYGIALLLATPGLDAGVGVISLRRCV